MKRFFKKMVLELKLLEAWWVDLEGGGGGSFFFPVAMGMTPILDIAT